MYDLNDTIAPLITNPTLPCALSSNPTPTRATHAQACAVYRWTAANSYFVISAKDHLAVGSGGHFALWLDSELLHGSSGPSQTFANPCLSRRSNAASAEGAEVGPHMRMHTRMHTHMHMRMHMHMHMHMHMRAWG